MLGQGIYCRHLAPLVLFPKTRYATSMQIPVTETEMPDTKNTKALRSLAGIHAYVCIYTDEGKRLHVCTKRHECTVCRHVHKLYAHTYIHIRRNHTSHPCLNIHAWTNRTVHLQARAHTQAQISQVVAVFRQLQWEPGCLPQVQPVESLSHDTVILP